MKHIFSLLFIFILCSYISVYACGWEYGVDAHGRKTEMDGMISSRLQHLLKDFSETTVLNRLHELQYQLDTQYNYKKHSDYGLQLLKLGRTSEALYIFQNLAMTHPEEYQILANLGTTYELAGNNDSALWWIQKALSIYPDSHWKSEWVHVQILQAKIQRQRKPNYYLVTENILKLDTIQWKGSYLKGFQYFEQIVMQLVERMPFTPAPDTIIYNICLKTADMTADHLSLEKAYILYHYALGFSSDPKNPIILNKIQQMEQAAIKYKVKLNKEAVKDLANLVRNHKVLNIPVDNMHDYTGE